jgi:hypothetical protein
VVANDLALLFGVCDKFEHQRQHQVARDAANADGSPVVVDPRSLFDDPLHPVAARLLEGGERLRCIRGIAQAPG